MRLFEFPRAFHNLQGDLPSLTAGGLCLGFLAFWIVGSLPPSQAEMTHLE